MQWNYGIGYEVDAGRTSESCWVTEEVLLLVSPIPAMVNTLSTKTMPMPVTSSIHLLFRVRYYPWDCCLLTVELNAEQYPHGAHSLYSKTRPFLSILTLSVLFVVTETNLWFSCFKIPNFSTFLSLFFFSP